MIWRVKVVGKCLSVRLFLELTRVTRQGRASIMFRVARQQLGLDFWTSSLLLPRWGYRLARQWQNIDCASSLQSWSSECSSIPDRGFVTTYPLEAAIHSSVSIVCKAVDVCARQPIRLQTSVPWSRSTMLIGFIAPSVPLCLFTVCCLQSCGYVQICTVCMYLFMNSCI